MKRYRQSELKDYLDCGLRYQFKHIDKIETLTSFVVAGGLAVDKAVSANLTQKIHSGLDMPSEQVIQIAVDETENLKEKIMLQQGERLDVLRSIVAKMTKFYQDHVAPTIKPAAVQDTFSADLTNEYGITGTMDLIDADGNVRDLKTASSQRVKSYIVNGTLQPAMYWFGHLIKYGKYPKKFIFDIIKRPKLGEESAYIKTEGEVKDTDMGMLMYTIESAHKGIKAGVALPAAEGGYKCSEKYCEFWHLCKGKKA